MSIINIEKQDKLTHIRLLELLEYNKDTGIFTNKITRSSRAVKGNIAGNLHSSGYYQVTIDNQVYYMHRLAWFYIFESWPKNLLDHIDRDTKNNKITNLREVSQLENMQNTKNYNTNTTGFKGVSFSKRSNKFKATISLNNKPLHLGYYDTPEEAHNKYLEAVLKKKQGIL